MTHCDRCGIAVPGDGHHCSMAADLEPPRFCADCGRRMVVQVLPRGWSAHCIEHGVRRG